VRNAHSVLVRQANHLPLDKEKMGRLPLN